MSRQRILSTPKNRPGHEVGGPRAWQCANFPVSDSAMADSASIARNTHGGAHGRVVDTGVLKLLRNGIVGDARRRPDDAVDIMGSAGEDVAPTEGCHRAMRPVPPTGRNNREF
jgi:hypothetical protein